MSFSYNEVLSLLLTIIYIYRLTPTWSKAHSLNKVSICFVDILMTIHFLLFLYKTHDATRYGLKACSEKVRWEAEPREEGGRGTALIEWEKSGFLLIFK